MTFADLLTGEELNNRLEKCMPPLPRAFIRSMLSLSEMRVREEGRTCEYTYSAGKDTLHFGQQTAESHHAALLYLSHLGETDLFVAHGGLAGHLRSLPRCLDTILRILFRRCRENPPPNCAPRMYSLMGELLNVTIFSSIL